MTKPTLRITRLWATCVCVSALAACGGGGGGASTPPPVAATYAVGGNVMGLAASQSAELSDGHENLVVSASGAFTFPTKLSSGSSYSVTVVSQPSGQFCNVGNAGGTVSAPSVLNISVVCAMVYAGGSGTAPANGGTVSTAAASVTTTAGASFVDQQITITTVAPPAGLPASLTPIGAAVDIAISDPDKLNAPLVLTIAYDASVVGDETQLAVVHYDSTVGSYEPVTILGQNTTAHSFRFDSRSFSPFLVVSYNANGLPTSYFTGFTPLLNSWSIANANSYLTPDGNCLGMAAYALWYVKNVQSPVLDANPAPFSTTPISAGAPSVAQLLAIRAQLAQSQSQSFEQSQNWPFTDAYIAQLMKMYLNSYKQPVILAMRGVQAGQSIYHVGILYGYDASGFWFYDPNIVASQVHLTFDGTSFGPYGAYTKFSYMGNPTLGRATDFATLTAEAQGGFTSSTEISLATPSGVTTATQTPLSVTGSFSGSVTQIPNLQTIAYSPAASTQPTASPGFGAYTLLNTTNPTFSGSVPLNPGPNTVVILAGDQYTLLGPYVNVSNWFPGSAALVFNISLSQPTQTEITANPTVLPSAGGSVTLTATIAASPVTVNPTAPTGTVTFTDQTGATLCANVSVTSGSATCSTSVTIAPDTVTANYNGDSNYVASSGTATIETGTLESTTTLTATYNGISTLVSGGSYSLTATVAASPATAGAPAPTGTVQFADPSGASILCSAAAAVPVSSGSASCSAEYSTLSINIYAFYSGDQNYAPSSGIISNVNVPFVPSNYTQAVLTNTGSFTCANFPQENVPNNASGISNPPTTAFGTGFAGQTPFPVILESGGWVPQSYTSTDIVPLPGGELTDTTTFTVSSDGTLTATLNQSGSGTGMDGSGTLTYPTSFTIIGNASMTTNLNAILPNSGVTNFFSYSYNYSDVGTDGDPSSCGTQTILSQQEISATLTQ